MFVSSFSSQQDSERTGRQLIIHYNYKTPINPDIDSAIDPDQHVRRTEGGAEDHSHTQAGYSLYSFWVFNSSVFLFFVFIFHPVHHMLKVAVYCKCSLRCCSTEAEQLSATERCLDSLFLFFKSIFLRLWLIQPWTEC